MGSRPMRLKGGSAPGTRLCPAPGRRGLPRTIGAWLDLVRTFYRGPRRAVEAFTPGGPIRP